MWIFYKQISKQLKVFLLDGVFRSEIFSFSFGVSGSGITHYNFAALYFVTLLIVNEGKYASKAFVGKKTTF